MTLEVIASRLAIALSPLPFSGFPLRPLGLLLVEELIDIPRSLPMDLGDLPSGLETLADLFKDKATKLDKATSREIPHWFIFVCSLLTVKEFVRLEFVRDTSVQHGSTTFKSRSST